MDCILELRAKTNTFSLLYKGFTLATGKVDLYHESYPNKFIAGVCVHARACTCMQSVQSLVSLKYPQSTYVTYRWAKSPNAGPRYYKMLSVSCNLTNAAQCP